MLPRAVELIVTLRVVCIDIKNMKSALRQKVVLLFRAVGRGYEYRKFSDPSINVLNCYVFFNDTRICNVYT
jgi:hypothetical protein